MSILKAIKDWWKPEVKQPKIRVRFNSDGHMIHVVYPIGYTFQEVMMMNQEIASYKIKIGQINPISELTMDGFS